MQCLAHVAAAVAAAAVAKLDSLMRASGCACGGVTGDDGAVLELETHLDRRVAAGVEDPGAVQAADGDGAAGVGHVLALMVGGVVDVADVVVHGGCRLSGWSCGCGPRGGGGTTSWRSLGASCLPTAVQGAHWMVSGARVPVRGAG